MPVEGKRGLTIASTISTPDHIIVLNASSLDGWHIRVREGGDHGDELWLSDAEARALLGLLKTAFE